METPKLLTAFLLAFSLTCSTCLDLPEVSTTCASRKVKSCCFVPSYQSSPRFRKFVRLCCSAEDRPADVARVRGAAREAMNSLLGIAFDTALKRNAANSARSSAENIDTFLSSQKLRVGFVGTGTITTAVVTGLLSQNDACDLAISVSPRNAERATALKTKFNQVSVANDNQQVLDDSDIVCLAVTPAMAEDVLRPLKFRPDHKVVSFMSTVTLQQLNGLVAPATAISRAIPMPPIARGLGPCALYPSTPEVSSLFARTATVIDLGSESELAVLMSTASLMAPFYHQQQTITQWMATQGVASPVAARYVGALFHSLTADALHQPGGGETCSTSGGGGPDFAALTAASQTPGGLNEQALRQLTAGGYYGLLAAQLDVILARVQGRPAPPAPAAAAAAPASDAGQPSDK